MTKKEIKSTNAEYVFGEAYHEIKDEPHFETLYAMEDFIKNGLREEIESLDPEVVNYNEILCSKIGMIKGIDRLRRMRREYESQYLEERQNDD